MLMLIKGSKGPLRLAGTDVRDQLKSPGSKEDLKCIVSHSLPVMSLCFVFAFEIYEKREITMNLHKSMRITTKQVTSLHKHAHNFTDAHEAVIIFAWSVTQKCSLVEPIQCLM